MIKKIVHFLRKRTSISFRIYLYSLSIFFISLLMILFFFYSYFSHIKNERVDFIDFISTEILTGLAEKGLRRGNSDLVLDTFDTLIKKSEISYIKIVDNESNAFLVSGIDLSEKLNTRILSKPIYSKRTVSNQMDLDFDGGSVITEQRLIGTLYIYIDLEQITSTALNTANEEIFFLLLLLIIFCLFIPYIISQSLVNPLRHIMSDLAKFKEENYEFLSNHDLYIDEYAKLSEALSTAGASITKAKNEIIEKNKSLREKVVLLTEARNTADEANSRKDVFVKNMTHELKTPLSGAISGNDLLENYLYELLSMLDSEEVIESKLYKMRESIFNCIRFVDISNRGISQVNSLVDNILLSIQDISENIYIQNSPNDIYTSLQGLYEYYKEVCEQKNIEFVYKNNIKENIYIICDWGRLSQILNSLLSNAVKFTTHGYVKFIVIFSYRVNSIDVKFEISDSGIGISDKEKIYIFDLFQIAQSPENKFSSGIGTGLSTSKRLAESMGGKIYLKDSKIGVGTTFLFECELPVCDENTNSVNSFLVNKNNYSFSVLYVEDSYLNQTIFKEYCNEYGVDLMLAHDGKEGFEKYKLTIFNIIVIDCYMPVMNGFQLIKKIRDHESANNLEPSYIVALTADNSDQNRLRCQKYGFDLFITKPYNRHHFKQILSKGKNLK